jgi:hypothetical protein
MRQGLDETILGQIGNLEINDDMEEVVSVE